MEKDDPSTMITRCTCQNAAPAGINFSFGLHTKNCRPFELLVDKCEEPAVLFSELVPRTMSDSKTVGDQTRPPEAVYMW